MKIGIIYYQYPLYNKGSYIQEQVDALANNEKIEEVVLITTKFPKNVKFNKSKNLKIIWLPRFAPPLIYDLFFNFFLVIYGIFSNDFRQVNLINVVCARGVVGAIWLKKFLRLPLVATIEIINDPKLSFFDKLAFCIQRYSYTRKSIDKIICWSKYYYDNYLKKWGISEKELSYIACGVDLELFDYKKSGKKIRKKYKIDKDEKLFVFAKPMYEYNRRSAELLLESLALVKEFKYRVLIGNGEQKAILEKKIAKLNMKNKVVFMPPNVPLTEIPDYLAAANIIALTFSYPATTARSFLEALAMKRPVVVTEVGEIPNIVENKNEVLMVGKNSKEIKRAVVTLMADKKLAKKISQNGFNLVQKKYSIKIIAEQTATLFKNVYEKNK